MRDKKTINLWNGNPPSKSGLSGNEVINQKEVLEATNVTEAQLIIYSPEPTINTGMATIICPGGAYAGLAITMQGYDFAEWLASVGITGIVLKYRMPNGNKEIPLDDVQEAIRYVRSNASALGINEHKIGVTGFSAGGHLAALASTLFSEEGVSTRPDFSILFYPVISMGAATQKKHLSKLVGRESTLISYRNVLL
ncbi:alpha/beta hydrolase [Pedobacter sp. NJ-S-72]